MGGPRAARGQRECRGQGPPSEPGAPATGVVKPVADAPGSDGRAPALVRGPAGRSASGGAADRGESSLAPAAIQARTIATSLAVGCSSFLGGITGLEPSMVRCRPLASGLPGTTTG